MSIENKAKEEAGKIDGGGPAFSKTGTYNDLNSAEYDSVNQDGMKLRDWFAGQAMAAKCFQQLAAALARSLHPVDGQVVTLNLDHGGIAKDCYDFADAMLSARKSGVSQ